MDSLERDLREQLERQVATSPALPMLAATALRRGRRARRRRTALVAATGVVAAALVLGAISLVGPLPDRRRDLAAAPVDGPPRVPMYLGQGGEDVLDWAGGRLRTRSTGGSWSPVAQVPSGLLVVLDGPPSALGLLTDDAVTPRPLVADLTSREVAVSDDGARAALVVGSTPRRTLREVALPSGRVLRSVPLGPTLAGTDEPAFPAAYSGDTVLLTVGEGRRQRAALWEPGDDRVVRRLGGYLSAAGGTDGRAALAVADDRCRIEVRRVAEGDGGRWRLCREAFVDFSPDGRAVLATDAMVEALVVRAADDGAHLRTFRAPQGLRAYGWEGSESVLYTTVDEGRTVVMRCSVPRGTCSQATSFGFTDRIPQPVPATGRLVR